MTGAIEDMQAEIGQLKQELDVLKQQMRNLLGEGDEAPDIVCRSLRVTDGQKSVIDLIGDSSASGNFGRISLNCADGSRLVFNGISGNQVIR